MANIISPHTLVHPEAPPLAEMIDIIQNLTADYVLTHRRVPKYLYINTEMWLDVMTGLLPTLDMYGLEVVTHPDMPYLRAALHSEYHDPGRIARWHQGFTDEEGLDSGRLILE